jgi:hypothetical protein
MVSETENLPEQLNAASVFVGENIQGISIIKMQRIISGTAAGLMT